MHSYDVDPPRQALARDEQIKQFGLSEALLEQDPPKDVADFVRWAMEERWVEVPGGARRVPTAK